MTTKTTDETPEDAVRPTVIDCRAPRHDAGSTRLLLTPGAVSLSDGTAGHAVVLVRLGRPTGSVDSLFRGTSLYGASEVTTGAIRDREPDAVWITDRSYFRRHWSPWSVDRLESRLAAAAADVDAPLVVWTGRSHETDRETAGRTDSDGSAAGPVFE